MKIQPTKICCKCGKTFPKSTHVTYVQWESRRFCSNKCRLSSMTGSKSLNFKGGSFLSSNGYRYTQCKGHPFSSWDGYVEEHRLVMEKHIGRFLEKGEIVHHVNHIRSDNRIENLKILTQNEHMRVHATGNKYWLGKKHTLETRSKMSKSMTGLKHNHSKVRVQA